MSKQKLSDLRSYRYEFDEQQIAHEPTSMRSGSRLLIRHADGHIVHGFFKDLAQYLEPGTLLINNDTRVFPARILARKPSGGKIELFLLHCEATRSSSSTWKILTRPFKFFRDYEELKLPEGVVFKRANIINDPDGTPYVVGEFNRTKSDLLEWLNQHGQIPLPPYIKRMDDSIGNQLDKDRYQTTYAGELGSVAAPTAGLHFDEETFASIQQKGVEIASVTLHVGAGTFLPIKSADITDHKMHTEWYRVPMGTCQKIAQAKRQGKPIIAVGTTTLRTLESFYIESDRRGPGFDALADQWLQTNLFIHPTESRPIYTPRAISGLITNFHQPESSLFVLVSALIGLDNAHDLYRCAVKDRYRLFSYGDASLLWL